MPCLGPGLHEMCFRAESHGKSHADSYCFTRPIHGIVLFYFVCCMLTPMKMSRTLLMFSTMTTRTIQKIMFIVLAVLAVLGRTVPQSPFSPLIVCAPLHSRLKHILTRDTQTPSRFEKAATPWLNHTLIPDTRPETLLLYLPNQSR